MKLSEWVLAAAARTGSQGPQPTARRQVADALRDVKASDEDPIIFWLEDWPALGIENPILMITVWAALKSGLAVTVVHAHLNPSRDFVLRTNFTLEVGPWRAIASDIRLSGFGTQANHQGEYTLTFGPDLSMRAEPPETADLIALWRECGRLAGLS